MNLVTVREGAKLLGTTPASIYRMVRENILPPGCFVRFGRLVRLNLDELEAHAKRGGSALPGGWKKGK